MDEQYPAGEDLSKFFPKPIQPDVPLPPRFDDKCVYCTEVKPFATFQCPACKTRLLLYEAPGTPHDPFFIWTGDAGIANREDVRKRLKEREEKEERDLARHTAAVP